MKEVYKMIRVIITLTGIMRKYPRGSSLMEMRFKAESSDMMLVRDEKFVFHMKI